MHEPELLTLDEPIAGLDPLVQHSISGQSGRPCLPDDQVVKPRLKVALSVWTNTRRLVSGRVRHVTGSTFPPVDRDDAGRHVERQLVELLR
jgi:ABC-type branched-subunit amino acid transport system ATPase component